MFEKFKYEEIEIDKIKLDPRNPRIVSTSPLNSQAEIVEYLFDYENLLEFIKKVSLEGMNFGAEKPYVVDEGNEYCVVEGNTRIAAYKVLTQKIAVPDKFASKIPSISSQLNDALSRVQCSIAPTRDDLLPIMANAHFGNGDKSKWGYLGSRGAVFAEWKAGKSVDQLVEVFDKSKSEISNLILEYQLYLEALLLDWDKNERDILRNPALKFNPPVRFLQASGHKEKVGISFDTVNLKILFEQPDSKSKFRHLIFKLVVEQSNGMKATSSYEHVFADYVETKQPKDHVSGHHSSDETVVDETGSDQFAQSGVKDADNTYSQPAKPKPNALFSYPVRKNSNVLKVLLKEAAEINSKRFPASATALLRAILESILKEIIHTQNANTANKIISLEKCIDIVLSKNVVLPDEDKRILKELKKSHLNQLNLSVHGSVVPNQSRLFAIRDCVDQFVMRNV